MKIFHIIGKSDWHSVKKERKDYEPSSLKTEGFIHCCKLDQILLVLNTFFKNQDHQLILVINQNNVKSKVVHETPYETPQSKFHFPHIYGPLNLDAVEDEIEVHPKDDGQFTLPKELFNDLN